MKKVCLVLFAFIALTVNYAHAVENKAKKNSSLDKKPLVNEASKVNTSPEPPKFIKDPTTGIELVYVKGGPYLGCYQMGDSTGEGGPEEKPAHEVCIENFYIGKYEVTQGQWKKIMGSNPSRFSSCGDNCPVDNVSWNNVQDFISRLNGKTKGAKNVLGIFRLPTEAEWEFAARSGGKKEKYSGTDDIESAAWYFSNSEEIQPVGLRAANGLGLYDMTGNVCEWTNDWYGIDYYSSSPSKNPSGPSTGSRRVVRGGSFIDSPFDSRTFYRNSLPPEYHGDGKGFRLVMTVPVRVK